MLCVSLIQNLMKIKKNIYRIVEKGSHGKKANLLFDYGIMLLIVLNVIALILETIPEIGAEIKLELRAFEIFSVVVFSIEYLMRLYISDLTHPAKSRIKSAMKFIFSAYGIIDLAAILPFYLPFLIKLDMRFLRLLRLLRFLRLMKVNRYNNSLDLIGAVFKEKRSELAVTGFIALLLLCIASFLMYDIEGKAQPDKFPNLLSAFWWAMATLTTVGYGDVYPITPMGKTISSIISILGIGIVALPTGIISAGFLNKLEQRKQTLRCPHCGKEFKNH